MSGLKTVITGVIAFFTTLYMAVSTLLFSPVVHPPIEEKAQDDIRILSFNIRCANVGIHQWDDRIGAVTGAIRAIAPDSFGVQEATPQWMEALREELPEYADVGVGRDDGVNRENFPPYFTLKTGMRVLITAHSGCRKLPMSLLQVGMRPVNGFALGLC